MGLSSGFVRTAGTRFELGGGALKLAGANNYYLAYASEAAARAVFARAAAMGLNALRTWAFLDCGSPEAGAEKPAGAKGGVFFQAWNPATGQPEVHDGPEGLERLDRAIALAEEYGIRLILPFANYWPDFGGVDQYLKWFGLSGSHRFYRDERVKDAYRRYVEQILGRVNTWTGRRYMEEPAILAWELMNEPRCVAEGGKALRDGVDALAGWIGEMSRFAKSLDQNHLLGVGDEGYFRRRGAGRNVLYNGHHGVDCERILGMPDIDFGTCHLYAHFAANEDAATFGARWIREHIEAGQRANKPMLIEEFGYKAGRAMGEEERRRERDRVFEAWLDEVEQSDGAGALVWMLAAANEKGERYPDYDGYTVYEADEVSSLVGFARRATSETASRGGGGQ